MSETLSSLFNRESRYMFILEKLFPLQGERAQSLKVYNIRMSVFKNNIIEMRKRRNIFYTK